MRLRWGGVAAGAGSSQETEGDDATTDQLSFSILFSLSPAPGRLLLTFRVGLAVSINPI